MEFEAMLRGDFLDLQAADNRFAVEYPSEELLLDHLW